MASYNRIVLVGNLTRDPELSYLPSNTAVCKFAIATNRRWKDREGNEREETCFVDCVIFGRGGEVFSKYMNKGGQALVEGRLTLNRWETPDGQKRSKHEVFVENFTFLGGGRGDGGGSGGGGGRRASQPSGVSSGGGDSYDDTDYGSGDDIPF